MNRFEPPPLPGESRSTEPTDPYASPAPGTVPAQDHSSGTQHPYAYGAPSLSQWGSPAVYNHPKGTTVLVLGILSVVVLPLLGPFAWVMGRSALKEADASAQQVTNRSSLVAGMVLGIVGTMLMVIGLVLVVLLFGSIFLFALAG
jgi:hypothetical protein